MQRQCQATTRSGEPCRMSPLAGRDWCFSHDPTRARERGEARRRGGQAVHRRTNGGNGGEVRIRSTDDVLSLLELAVGDVLTLEPSIARARTLTYIAGTASGLLETHDLARRLAAVEERLGIA